MKLGVIPYKFLFSKKSHSIVNLVAVVSVIAVAVPTAAMIIVLSLHNGLTRMVEDVFSRFDVELRVTAPVGQTFVVDSVQLAALRQFAEVSEVLDFNAIFEWEHYTTVAVLRGVDTNYRSVSALPSTVERGVWHTRLGDRPRAVLGAGVSYSLAYSVGVGRPLKVNLLLPTPALLKPVGIPFIVSCEIEAAGVFTVDASIDSRYVFTDIDFLRGLTGQYGIVSALEFKPLVGAVDAVRQIHEILGDDMVVQSRREQRALMYSTIEAEKLMIFFALLLVALIAAMSLAGCSLMMTTEKAHSASVLRSLGMNEGMVRRVFVRLSMLVVLCGVVVGVVLGVGFVAVQYYFEPLKMAGDYLLIDSYPVVLSGLDVGVTLLSVLVIGFLIVYFTTRSVNFELTVGKYGEK